MELTELLPFTPHPSSIERRARLIESVRRNTERIDRAERRGSLCKLLRGARLAELVGYYGPEITAAVAEQVGMSPVTLRHEISTASRVPHDLWRVASFSALRELANAGLPEDRMREILGAILDRGDDPTVANVLRELHEENLAVSPEPDPWALGLRQYLMARGIRDWGAEMPELRIEAFVDWALRVLDEYEKAQLRRAAVAA